ncbi:hypothetical protein [uncultured Nostoc sp.]|uniref:hypothetical protein n=1 Tax=uncultured Nostoc sp. TaxID=340711 RepID=UPI0035CB2D0F
MRYNITSQGVGARHAVPLRLYLTRSGNAIVVENLLEVRFGEIDNELQAIIEPLLLLPPEEFTPLLLQLSREELIHRFC